MTKNAGSTVNLVNRHFYLIALGVTTLVLLGVVGFVLVNAPYLTNSADVLNPHYLFMWRVIFYICLWQVWQPLIQQRLKNKCGQVDCDWQGAVREGRKKLIQAIILFEVFIVQNIFGRTLGWVWGMFHGS